MEPTPSSLEQRRLYVASDPTIVLPDAGVTYFVVAKAWFDKWDRYATVLEGASISEAPEPPPMDNASIADANYPGAMKKNLSDGTDFVILPKATYELLKSWYPPVGNEFPRTAYALSDGSARIELYPQPCRVHPNTPADAPHVLVLVPRQASAPAVLDQLWAAEGVRRQLGMSSRSAVRLWVKMADGGEEVPAGPLLAPGGDADDDSWQPFWHPMKLEDFARNADVTDIVVEAREADGSWPRGLWYSPTWMPGPVSPSVESVMQWRRELKIGDHVDALDKQTWLQAVVKGIQPDPTGDRMSDKLEVHFTGWGAQYDIRVERRDGKLAPLYTHTAAWRLALRPGDFFEVCQTIGVDRMWHAGLVVTLDHGYMPARMTYMQTNAVSGAGAWNLMPQAVSLGDEDNISARPEHLRDWWNSVRRPSSPEAPLSPAVASFATAPLPPAAAQGVGTSTALVATGRADAASGVTTRSGGGVIGTVRRWIYGDDQDDDGGAEPAPASDQRAAAIAARNYYFNGTARRPATSSAGVCGLDNLGNTCFMNSMLQCLSNVKELTEFFLSDEYIAQINTVNALGSKGRMAHAYAALMHAMWSGQFSRVAPGPVKAIVGKRAPQFVGYGQQDSQEFMSFLLDLLLEDLCRVDVKPSVPTIESGVRPDAEVADEAWAGWQSRNSSRVADVFAGQFRSHVQCNVCGRNSITFDAFTSLSVPIPVEKYKSIVVFYFGVFNTRPQKFKYHFRASEVPSAAQLATLMVEDLRKDVAVPVADGDIHAAARSARGRVPASADEVLFAWITSDPCMARQYVPHFTSHLNARAYLTQTLRHVRDVTLFAYRIPHAGAEPAVEPGAPTLPPSAHPALAPAPFDYEDPAEDDDEYDSFSYGSSSKRKPAVARPPPVGRTGPRPFEFVNVWVRVHYSAASRGRAYGDGADSLMVPLTCDVSAAPLAAPITNRQFLDNAWAGIVRLTSSKRLDLPFEERPCKIGFFAFVFEKRNLLGTDYVQTGPTDLIPYDDAPFEWSRERQYVLDIPQKAKTDLFDGKEAATSFEHASFASLPPSQAGIALENCLEKFSVREQLGEMDKWYCSTCKDHVRAFKQMDVWRLPPVLIVHLKRFQYERGFYSSVIRGKIEDLVRFPTRGLDLAPFVRGPISEVQPPIYDLFAVSEHSGGMGGGHYTAHGMNFRDSRWYSYNDGYVGSAREGDGVRSTAYVLFYRLRKAGNVPAVPLAAGEAPAVGASTGPAGQDDDAMGEDNFP